MLKKILWASVCAVALVGPTQAGQWWQPIRSNPSSGVMDTCVGDNSPAKTYALLSSMESLPVYKDYTDFVAVVYRNPSDGQDIYLVFFRSQEDCQKYIQGEVENANKYR
jgi:hypothetical protein